MANIFITTLPASQNQNSEAAMLTELVTMNDNQSAQIQGGGDVFATCLKNESQWLGSWGAVPFCSLGWAITKVVDAVK